MKKAIIAALAGTAVIVTTVFVFYYTLIQSFYMPIAINGSTVGSSGAKTNVELNVSGGITIEPMSISYEKNGKIYGRHEDADLMVYIPQKGTAKAASEKSDTWQPTTEQIGTATMVFNKLKEAGFSDAAACGILGNIQAESGMRSSAVEIGSGEGWGLCQWSFGRKSAVKNYCKEHGYAEDSAEGQAEYLIHELETESTWISGLKSVGMTINEYKALQDMNKASDYFCVYWERPLIPNLETRQTYAQGYFTALGGSGGCTIKGVDMWVEGTIHWDEPVECTEHTGHNSYLMTFAGKINEINVMTEGYYCTKSVAQSGGDGTTGEIHTNGYWGTKVGRASGNLAEIALAEYDEGQSSGTSQSGGDKYWSWYGFKGHVHWCACFVSWCANEGGYIDAGIIPKYALVADGKNWFVKRGQYMKFGEGTPNPGDIAFYGPNGVDHTGIVVDVEPDGTIILVEGNVSNQCVKLRMDPVTGATDKGRDDIHGFGQPMY